MVLIVKAPNVVITTVVVAPAAKVSGDPVTVAPPAPEVALPLTPAGLVTVKFNALVIATVIVPVAAALDTVIVLTPATNAAPAEIVIGAVGVAVPVNPAGSVTVNDWPTAVLVTVNAVLNAVVDRVAGVAVAVPAVTAILGKEKVTDWAFEVIEVLAITVPLAIVPKTPTLPNFIAPTSAQVKPPAWNTKTLLKAL